MAVLWRLASAVCLLIVGLLCSSSMVAESMAYHVSSVNSVNKVSAKEVRAIFINYATALNTARLHHLVENALTVRINTLVIDYVANSPRYRSNVKWVQEQGLAYIPRIMMYPGGGTHEQLTSRAYLDKRMEQIDETVDLGAKQVQLDYIRYSYKNDPSPENARVVTAVIEQVKERLAQRHVSLQVDVFGIAAFRPSVRIGQDIAMIAPHIDALCPMVYPSHYRPYKEHSENPYGTIRSSLMALNKQLDNRTQVHVYPYVEAYNVRYPMNKEQRIAYIREQIRAVRESHADGWMVWSATNAYDTTFAALAS